MDRYDQFTLCMSEELPSVRAEWWLLVSYRDRCVRPSSCKTWEESESDLHAEMTASVLSLFTIQNVFKVPISQERCSKAYNSNNPKSHTQQKQYSASVHDPPPRARSTVFSKLMLKTQLKSNSVVAIIEGRKLSERARCTCTTVLHRYCFC